MEKGLPTQPPRDLSERAAGIADALMAMSDAAKMTAEAIYEESFDRARTHDQTVALTAVAHGWRVFAENAATMALNMEPDGPTDSGVRALVRGVVASMEKQPIQ